MTLVVQNSLTRKMEEFKPLVDGKVAMYTCGPTVYSTPHIGNYRTFFMADMMRRYFEFKGYEVFHLMNITDIDDKTIRDSAAEGLTLQEFTKKHTDVFFEGIDWLHMKRAHVYPRATDHIKEMIDLIKKLEEKGYAYETEDGVYFTIKKFKDYGKIANVDLETLKVGVLVKADTYEKGNVHDFALWKKSTQDEIKRKIFFESP
ncbi:MAG: class I tRNA ligase family protein, partial [Candidatus Heimdallarchaeota archaeon]